MHCNEQDVLMNNSKLKNHDVTKKSVCPVTGLPVTMRPDWENIDLGEGYCGRAVIETHDDDKPVRVEVVTVCDCP